MWNTHQGVYGNKWMKKMYYNYWASLNLKWEQSVSSAMFSSVEVGIKEVRSFRAGSHLAFSCQVSLFPYACFGSSVFLFALHSLDTTCQFIADILLNWVSFMFFSGLDWGYFCQKTPQEWCCTLLKSSYEEWSYKFDLLHVMLILISCFRWFLHWRAAYFYLYN